MASNTVFAGINITKQVAGFTMPSTTPVDTDPNSNPLDFFNHIKEFKDSKMGGLTTPDFANSPVYCLFDHSGSNADCAGLMKLIALAIQLTNSDTSIIPFGSSSSHEFKQFPAAMYNTTRTSCQWMTNTNFISLFFTQIVGRQTTPFTLVFLGDGEFNDSNFIRIIQDAARIGTLDRCQQLTILFSPHTIERTMAKLTTELTQICAQTRNVIPIQCHRLGNPDKLLPTDNTIITAIGKVSSVKLPKDWVRVGNWAMHEKLSMKSLIQVLSNNKLAADELLALIQQNAGINPALLNSHPIYGLLYRTLCHQSLYGKEMNAWMNRVLTDKTTTPDNRKILQQLLDTSRATAAKDAIATKLAALRESGTLIGFQKCADGAFSAKNVADIREAIKAMDFAEINRFAAQIVKTAQHQIISIRDVQPGDIIGIPILNSKKATQNDCLQALSLMFAQFAEDLVVNGLLLYCAALGMLFSDTAVSRLLHAQIERALFDNLFATLTNLGIRTCPKTSAVSWDEDTHHRIMQPAVCGLLALAYTHFGDRLFPGVDFSNRQGDGSTNPAPEHILAVTAEVLGGARAYTINRFINKLINDPAYLVRGKFSFGLFPDKRIMWNRNIICAFKPFAKDPQPNLPSLGYTIGAVGETRWRLEYLDRPLHTDDTVTLGLSNLIPIFDLSGMPGAQRDAVLRQFNQWLHKMQQDGARGLLGTEMLMNTNQSTKKGRLPEFPVPGQHIIRNQELYDANMHAAIVKISELITATGLNPVTYQIGGYTPITRPLTRSEAVTIISDMAALTPEAIQIYNRGNNLNADDIKICKARNPIATQRIPDGIPADLIASVRAAFVKAMVPPPLPHLQVGTTNTCVCCLDTLANRHMVRLGCTHNLCYACHDVMVGYQPTPGEPVNMAMCRCPVCQNILTLRHPVLLAAIQTTDVANNSVLLRCRIPDCPEPYYSEPLTCGATADTLDKLCLKHRPKEEDIKVTTCPNPACGASLTRDSGCDVVRCHCHQALCFGCGAALPISTIHWDCHGSRAECDAAVAHRATDPDNWSDSDEDW